LITLGVRRVLDISGAWVQEIPVPEAEVTKFMQQVFIIPTHQKCREHGMHQKLLIVVPLGNGEGAKSIMYRIAENSQIFYLRKKKPNLRT
jgi:hypothetical protein